MLVHRKEINCANATPRKWRESVPSVSLSLENMSQQGHVCSY